MGLFRPYERKDLATDKAAPDAEKRTDTDKSAGPRKRQSMVIGSDSRTDTTTRQRQQSPAPTAAPPVDTPEPNPDGHRRGPREKSGPTPTRREAEAARRERVNPNLSKKESKRLANRTAREQRLTAMEARESQPEKVLLRNYVDSRFSLGEFLLPALLIVLALSFLNTMFPSAVYITTGLMYLFILLVLIDGFVMWRGYKRLLAERIPHGSPKGLIYYGMMRMIQFRRLRMPRPHVKRGDDI